MIRLKNSNRQIVLFGVFLSAILVMIGALLLVREMEKRSEEAIVDFDTCAKKYPVMESYPEQCVTKAGKRFVSDIGNELSYVDEIIIQNPRPTAVVKSPLLISGRARGGWFFEGQFTAYLYDDQGGMVGEAVVRADSESMTNEWVDFSGKVEFVTTAKKGRLILRNANPSGLPDNSKELIVPVKFAAL